MTGNKLKNNYSIIFSFVILIFYFINPKPFVYLGNKLFSPFFSYNSQSISEDFLFSNSLSIIARPPQTKYDQFIVVNNFDLEIGDYVESKEGYLLGEIVDLISENAFILLFSSPESSHSVSLNDYVTNTIGLGLGGILIEVPINIDVSLGDEIFLQDIGVRIATVQKIELNEDELKNNIYALLPINIFELKELNISSFKKIQLLNKEDILPKSTQEEIDFIIDDDS